MKIISRSVIAGFLVLSAAGSLVRAGTPAVAKPESGYTVTVEMKANEKGEVENVALVSTDDQSPGDVLTKMALAMAAKTTLPPHIGKEGKPVKFKARAPFFFPVEFDEGAAADQVPKPRVKDAVQPVYPPDLREKGVTGGAILELVIDEQGKLTQLKTLSAANPEFEKAATESVQKWTFTAAQLDGKPVVSRTRLAIVFETEDNMAEVKWRIAPRPRLGSLTVIRPDHPVNIVEPETKAEAKPGAAAEAAPSIAPPAATTPAK